MCKVVFSSTSWHGQQSGCCTGLLAWIAVRHSYILSQRSCCNTLLPTCTPILHRRSTSDLSVCIWIRGTGNARAWYSLASVSTRCCTLLRSRSQGYHRRQKLFRTASNLPLFLKSENKGWVDDGEERTIMADCSLHRLTELMNYFNELTMVKITLQSTPRP
jgi:hypothetical protein